MPPQPPILLGNPKTPKRSFHDLVSTWGLAILLPMLCFTTIATAQSTEEWRSWNQPVEPFRVVDNVYYVGASDIASYLITSDEGHIVIDGGFVETAPMIRDNIIALGFELSDVKLLLNSHAHFDHCAGLADLAEWTGAEVVASEADAPIIESGGAGDYFIAAEHNAFPAVAVGRRVKDGDQISLGDVTLTAQVTAGHTRGCTSWSLPVDDHGTDRTAVFICSVSLLPGVQLLDNPAYPNIVEDYQASFERLESLPCEVFLAAHGQFFNLTDKRQEVATAKVNPFVDPEGCDAYLARNKKRFDKELAKQRAAFEGAASEGAASEGAADDGAIEAGAATGGAAAAHHHGS